MRLAQTFSGRRALLDKPMVIVPNTAIVKLTSTQLKCCDKHSREEAPPLEHSRNHRRSEGNIP